MIGWSGGWRGYHRDAVQSQLDAAWTEEGATSIGGVRTGVGAYGLGYTRQNKPLYRKKKSEYFNTGDIKHLYREPCLSDPAYRSNVAERIRKNVTDKKRYNLEYYFIADECSLTSYADAFDFCFSPPCMKSFRAWLKAKYKTAGKLGEAWDDPVVSFAEALPKTTQQAQKSRNWASWGDHRLYMEHVYADTFKFYLDEIRKHDPEGKTLISGTQRSACYNAQDWYQLSQHIAFVSAYSGGNNWELFRSFQPRALLGTWTGYGASGRGVKYAMWSALLHNVTRPNIFWGYSYLNPDLTLSKSGRDLGAVFQDIRTSGLGRFIQEAERLQDGIAIHYSYASIHALRMLNREKEYLSGHTDWLSAIQDLGMQFDFVSTQQIESGRLLAKSADGGLRYRVLVLARSIALSDAECDALNRYQKAGGRLLADVTPGEYFENCRKRSAPALRGLPIESIELAGYRSDRNDRKGETKRNALSGLLQKAGVRPHYTVTLAGTKTPLPSAEVVVYRLGGTEIVCVLKENTNVRRIVASDGTVSYKDIRGAGAAAEKITVDIGSPMRVHDVRARRRLGRLSRIETSIAPGECKVFAVRSVRPREITGRYIEGASEVGGKWQARRGATIRIAGKIALQTGKSTGRSCLRMNVTAPDGRRHPHYSQSTLSDARTGSFAFEIPIAFNDALGTWQIEIFDVATGLTIGGPLEIVK